MESQQAKILLGRRCTELYVDGCLGRIYFIWKVYKKRAQSTADSTPSTTQICVFSIGAMVAYTFSGLINATHTHHFILLLVNSCVHAFSWVKWWVASTALSVHVGLGCARARACLRIVMILRIRFTAAATKRFYVFFQPGNRCSNNT